MDYLTIIATRCVVLFPKTITPSHHRSFSNSSSSSDPNAPRTPTSCIPRPGPVTMPIESLMYSDTEAAYYLLTHVLTHGSLFPSAVHLGEVTKEVANEAEVMVWGEIDKAKMFIRALGAWFAQHKEAITEKEMESLAGEWGLGWKNEADEMEDELEELVERAGLVEVGAMGGGSAIVA